MSSPSTTLPDAEVSLQQEVDELGELDRQVQQFAPVAERHEALKKKFQARAEEKAADCQVYFHGALYEIQMSARRRERTVVNKKKVFGLLKRALGIDGVVALLEIPFGSAIDKYIPKSEQKGIIHEEQSGHRTLNLVALHPAAPRE